MESPYANAEAFEQGRGLLPLEDLGVVTVAGQDRLTWLTSLSSQIFTENGSCEALFLDPQGRIRFAVGAVDDGDRVWLIVEGGAAVAAELASFLQSMRFLLRVDVEDVSACYRGFAWTVPSDRQGCAAGAAAASVAILWRDPWPDVVDGGTSYSSVQRHPAEGSRRLIALVPAAQSAAFQSQWLEDFPGGVVVDAEAASAWQVAAWRPSQAMVDAKSLPAEFDWLRTAVHLDKGCYCGQESVARILNLGKPPRRLVFLHLDGSTSFLPQVGQELYLCPAASAASAASASAAVRGRPVGQVVAAARHHDMGPIALALVRRAVPADVPLCLLGAEPQDPVTSCSQEEIVRVDGRADRSPKERPGAHITKITPLS